MGGLQTCVTIIYTEGSSHTLCVCVCVCACVCTCYNKLRRTDMHWDEKLKLDLLISRSEASGFLNMNCHKMVASLSSPDLHLPVLLLF